MHAHARPVDWQPRSAAVQLHPAHSVLPVAAPRPPCSLRPFPSCPAHAGPSLACSFRLGRQEDAHEFLIALLDALHEASIAGMQPKPPPELAQTSFIYRIFGGRMRSQVGGARVGGGVYLFVCWRWQGAMCRGLVPLLPVLAHLPALTGFQAAFPTLDLDQPYLPSHTLQVKCSECGYESNTFDPCIDLSLEITRAASVKKALERFTAGG